MNLPDIINRSRVSPQGCQRELTVFAHPFRFVSDRAAQIQRSPRVRADTSLPGKNSLSQTMVQLLELKISDFAVRLKRHKKAYFLRTANFLASKRRVSAMLSSMSGNMNQAVARPNRKPVSTRRNGVLSR